MPAQPRAGSTSRGGRRVTGAASGCNGRSQMERPQRERRSRLPDYSVLMAPAGQPSTAARTFFSSS